MLSRTFNLNPVSRISKPKHKLSNPKLYLPVHDAGKGGKVVEISIDIPEGYGFLDDVVTFGEFLDVVKGARNGHRIYEEIFEVSQLTTDQVKMRGGYGGVTSGNSKGLTATASFLLKKDIRVLEGLTSLLPNESLDLPTAQTLSRFTSTLKRCGFITDDDGEVAYVRDYYHGSLPLFTISNIQECGEFSFTHLERILANV